MPSQIRCRGRVVCPATPPWEVKRGLEAVAPLIAEAQQHNRNGSTRGKVVVSVTR
ncbi:MAG TPA: hypothetical protein VJT10_24145 [Steroidobacteraceae bacterium]|nr:hypothetical protein [Steroidobacteraceae bacterium]